VRHRSNTRRALTIALLTAACGLAASPAIARPSRRPPTEAEAIAALEKLTAYAEKSKAAAAAAAKIRSRSQRSALLKAKMAALDTEFASEDRAKAIGTVARVYLATGGKTTNLTKRVDALRGNDPLTFARAIRKNTDVAGALGVAIDYHRSQSLSPEKLEAHVSAAKFPGPVSSDAKRITETVEIDASFHRGWISTGLYAAPGEVVELVLPKGTPASGLSVQVGCHKDSLFHKDSWNRFPRITRSFAITGPGTLKVGNAFGGLLYISVSSRIADGQAGKMKITFRGAVRAPYYVLGRTTGKQWTTVRTHPGPWAEFECQGMIFTVPSSMVRDMDDPKEVMTRWRDIMIACAELRGIDARRRTPMRIVCDRQISAGYMHSGYPIMGPLDRAVKSLLTAGFNWGWFHEIGHNLQGGGWKIPGTTEMSCNLWPVYLAEKIYKKTPGEVRSGLKQSFRDRAIRAHYAGGRDYAKLDFAVGLIMFIQVAEAAGWDTYKKTIPQYDKLERSQLPRTPQQQHDQWVVRLSKAAGKNLGPFFADDWGMPVSKEALQSIASLPEWKENPMIPYRPKATAAASKTK
jgi:hypothetical protein